MQKIYNFNGKDFIYLAPTKTGSETINSLLKMPKVHFTLDQEIVDNSVYKFATVRHPYDRVVSMYNFFSIGKFSTFDEFLIDLAVLKQGALIYAPQYLYTHWNFKQAVDNIIKLEELEQALTEIPLFEGITEIPHLNKDKRKSTLLTDEHKEIIADIYPEDFELLGYLK